MAKKVKRKVTDKVTKVLLQEALKSRKLVQRMLRTIEKNPELRAQFARIMGQQPNPVAETELKYYGPENSEFRSGGRQRYEYFKAHGASKRIASALNIAEITPYQLFVMSEKDILETDGLGPATAEFARNLREQLSRPTITNIPE